jgi:uncharacterized protein (TIGR02284 family)
MDETQQRNGEVLNWLLQGATDSAQGFHQGADLARNPRLKALFSERAQQRERLAGEIAAEVRSFEQPASGRGTVIGEAHRAFTYLRDAISRDSDKGLVEELLRRERTLCEKFQSAVDDTRLPAHARGVATAALPGFAETADELRKIDQEFAGASPENAPLSGRLELTEEDNKFLEPPEGSTVLAAGSGGMEGRIERATDTVVRIGVQSVAVATAQGGGLSISIEAGGAKAEGRDGPAPMERRLSASGSLEVLVKSGVAITYRAQATPTDAQLLRTIVWSLDLGDSAATTVDAAPAAATEPATGVTAEAYGRSVTQTL